MNFAKYIYITGILLFLLSCHSKVHIRKPDNTNSSKPTEVVLGIDNFLTDHLKIVENKRVGLVTNPSGVTGNLEYTSDVFFHHPKVNLVALFGPEHGVRGNMSGGDTVANEIDIKTGIPLFSLYGDTKNPQKK